jgi:UDP-glucose 4-epimerase
MLEPGLMRILVTGSAGHLGEALMRTFEPTDHEAVGLDVKPSPHTTHVGSIADRDFVARCMDGIEAVLHTATLHKPHVGTHTRGQFIDTNITGTLNLLEEAALAGVGRFIFTSTTSTFGDAMSPPPGAPAVWVTEDLTPRPKNIYGVTKTAAEDLCQLFHRNQDLPCIILKTSRFFPEQDDHPATRDTYDDPNLKLNELLNRRADIEDIVTAHLAALEKAPALGFGRYIITATTPFTRADAHDLATDAAKVVRRLVPEYENVYEKRGWKMFPTIDRIYDNARARADLAWNPRHDFASTIARLQNGEDLRSPLAKAIGSKGYHTESFDDGPYPVE